MLQFVNYIQYIMAQSQFVLDGKTCLILFTLDHETVLTRVIN